MLEIEFSMKFERELRCVKLLSSIQSPVKKSQVYTYMYDILLVFTKEVTKPQNHKIPLNSTCQFLDCTAASPATNLWLSGHTFGKVAVIQKFLYFVWGSHVGRHAKIGNLTK